MRQLTFEEYRGLRTCLKKLDYDEVADDIILTVAIDIPAESDTESVLIGFVRNYIQEVIEEEINTEIGVTICMFDGMVRTALQYDKNDLEPAQKLKLFCQTFTALMKINLVDSVDHSDDVKLFTLDFIKRYLPEYLNQNALIKIKDKNILICRTPEALVNIAVNKVSFFLKGNKIEKKALEILPEELAEKFNAEKEQDLPSRYDGSMLRKS